VGYCYPSGLEKTLPKWDILIPLVTKGFNNFRSPNKRSLLVCFVLFDVLQNLQHVPPVCVMPRMSLIHVNAHTTGRCHAETFDTQRVVFNVLFTLVCAGAGIIASR
jgi:hypothetical protein